MAFGIWKGPNGQVGTPASGDWFDAANWFKGALPDQSTDVVLGAGDYSVTLNGAGAHVHSISIGRGVSTALSGTAASLITDAASINQGSLSVAGGYLEFDADFLNLGALYGEVSGGYIPAIAGSGTITNEGVISTAPGASQGYMGFFGTVVNDVDGLITTLAGPGQLFLLGTTTNMGRIAAVGGGTVSTSAASVGNPAVGTVTNVDGGTLSGGTWVAEAYSTILLANTTISALSGGATVTLEGLGSTFRVDDGGNSPFTLEQTLNLVDAGATLEVLGGRDWTTSETLGVRGTLHLGGGVFAPGDLRTEAGSVMTGFGTVASQAIVDGLLKVDGGQTLEFTTFADFNGKIAGGGTLALSGGEDTFTTGKVSVKHLLFDGADVQFDQSLKYAGELTVTTGTIDLKDSRLTLAGKATIGAATIQGGPDGALSVTGELHAQGGVTELDVRSIRVDGAVSVDHGTLLVNGAVAGGGGFTVGAQGVLEFEAAGRVSAGPLVTLAGANATVVFDSLASNGVRIAEFDGKDTIDFAGLSSTGARLTWRADDDGQGGTLKVTNGGQTATVHLEENHVKADFALKTDAGGGVVVTLAKTAAFGVVDGSAFGGDVAIGHGGGHLFAAGAELHGMLALA